MSQPRLNPTLVVIMHTDKKPYHHIVLAYAKNADFTTHPRRPVAPHGLEMERGVERILQPQAELLPRLRTQRSRQRGELLTKRERRRGLHSVAPWLQPQIPEPLPQPWHQNTVIHRHFELLIHHVSCPLIHHAPEIDNLFRRQTSNQNHHIRSTHIKLKQTP